MKKFQGFTLIEVLISIFIMAIIAQATYTLMSSVVESDFHIEESTNRINEVQRAFFLLERDFTQMVPRKSRIDGKQTLKTIEFGERKFESDKLGFSFIRGGIANPGAELPKGEIARVWYRLKDNALERATYPYPDTTTGYKPQFEKILTKVKSFKITFYKQGLWSNNWSDSANVPQGIKIELELEDMGKYPLVYYVVAGI